MTHLPFLFLFPPLTDTGETVTQAGQGPASGHRARWWQRAGAQLKVSIVRLQRLGQASCVAPLCEEETPPVRGGGTPLLQKCHDLNEMLGFFFPT